MCLWSVIKLGLSADDKRSLIQRLLGEHVAALRGDMKLGKNVLGSASLSVFKGKRVAEWGLHGSRSGSGPDSG